ncbi:hypothetical protein B9Z55_011042 [Caenorhabditis nigoni]|nr:hypothetical protein B9Z55_011042 [Caenorhabditis nigoni]
MRYWRHQVNSFFNNVLLAPNGPLATVTHFFYHVEYQHRGTQHVNCVDRPVEDFIVAHLTARIPNETEEERLYKVVVQNQMHWKKHSMTCQRMVKIRGRFTTTRCRRYSIPGVTRASEFLVNDYNAAILLFQKANIDLQNVPADATDIVNYITLYTTKGEKAKRWGKKTWTGTQWKESPNPKHCSKLD